MEQVPIDQVQLPPDGLSHLGPMFPVPDSGTEAFMELLNGKEAGTDEGSE